MKASWKTRGRCVFLDDSALPDSSPHSHFRMGGMTRSALCQSRLSQLFYEEAPEVLGSALQSELWILSLHGEARHPHRIEE